jgi:hypothetical protein
MSNFSFFQPTATSSEAHPSTEASDDPFKRESETEMDPAEVEENGCATGPEVAEPSDQQAQVSVPAESINGISLFNEVTAQQVKPLAP